MLFRIAKSLSGKSLVSNILKSEICSLSVVRRRAKNTGRDMKGMDKLGRDMKLNRITCLICLMNFEQYVSDYYKMVLLSI